MTPLHTRSCSCGPCERARIRRAHFDVIGGGYRDITPTARWTALLARLEDASGYALLLLAVCAVCATDAYLWLTFGPWLFATLAAACGSVAAMRVRAIWPLLLALGCFLSATFAAYVALGLFALVARVWTALMGVPA